MGLVLFSSLLVAPAGAQKKNRKQSTDSVIFGRENALWVVGPAGGDEAKLIDLPFPAQRVDSLKVSSSGTALLVAGNGFVGWTSLADDTVHALRFLPCSGPSNLSADGKRVVCGTQDTTRIAIYTLEPKLDVIIVDRKAAGPLAFAESPDEIISLGESGDIVALSKNESRVVAPHQPTSGMQVTPDGKRAVGAYNEGAINVVYTFRLDGKATKRTLVHAARAVGIAAGSTWAAVQQEVDACAVRIAGGQYMCWRSYQAVAISSEGHSLLVSRNEKERLDLFLATVAGTSSKKPFALVKGVAGVATFWRR